MGTRQDELIDLVVAEHDSLAMELGLQPLSPRVVAALRHVPRAAFVPVELQELAHDNRPLPIGYEQTISQPFIVALMTGLLQLQPSDTVLEIGTGSGYQAAVLAELAGKICSIERVLPLADAARARLRRLGYRNVLVKAGDGSLGWPEESPFDAVVVTAAAQETPEELLAQLKPRGRMVIPLEVAGGEQVLTRYTRAANGECHSQAILPVRFVPLLRGEWVAGVATTDPD